MLFLDNKDFRDTIPKFYYIFSYLATFDFDFQKLVQVLGNGATKDDPTEKVVYVLTSNSFQKWLLAQGDPDRMFYNCDLENIGREAFATQIWVSNVNILVN